MMELPELTPVITPVATPIVAAAVLLLLHVPPTVTFEIVVVEPMQTPGFNVFGVRVRTVIPEDTLQPLPTA
jgi:hypothetical protein